MKKKVLNICLILLISFIFIDIVDAETYNNFNNNFSPVSCGDGFITDMSPTIPKVVSIIYNVIQIAVPIVLVVLGSLDLLKGISAQKEDEIKKGQQMFIKRLIAAAIIFFVFIIVKFLIGIIAKNSDEANRILDCTQCFINNDC